jgi:hypothetical protein
MTQTKAEQLAQDAYTSKYLTLEFAAEVADELRRLSPMEAERDKLIKLIRYWWMRSNHSLRMVSKDVEVGAAIEALKLAGEIK